MVTYGSSFFCVGFLGLSWELCGLDLLEMLVWGMLVCGEPGWAAELCVCSAALQRGEPG